MYQNMLQYTFLSTTLPFKFYEETAQPNNSINRISEKINPTQFPTVSIMLQTEVYSNLAKWLLQVIMDIWRLDIWQNMGLNPCAKCF